MNTAHPACPRCDYALEGLPKGPCPECGREFDPDDPASYARRSFLARMSPPHWLNVLFLIGFIVVVVTLCSPEGELADALSAGKSLLVPAIVTGWSVAFAAHLCGRVLLAKRNDRQTPWRWRWIVIPIVFGATVWIQDSGIVWHARWSMSKPAFAAKLNSTTPSSPSRLGLFWIEMTTRSTDGTTAFRVGFPDLYSQGSPTIVYSPQGWPVNFGPTVHNLGGGWWVVTDPT